jgi:hypothetical protein
MGISVVVIIEITRDIGMSCRETELQVAVLKYLQMKLYTHALQFLRSTQQHRVKLTIFCPSFHKHIQNWM